MSGYKQILVAVDFTNSTNQVLQKALEIKEQLDGELTFIHSVECSETVYTGDLVVPMDVGLCEELTRQARNKLNELVESDGFSGTRTIVSEGIPKREILQAAKEMEADLIIVGSHGRHGLQLLLGSTATGVLHQAPCDVLAVRVKEEA